MKRGSALLIVLGMVAFMVISAVAFSAYMRYSRLPSSYLRRTSSSRHLVKAALAEAIDRIDVAIGNDPYPGFGNSGTAYNYPRVDTDAEAARAAKRNYWRSHCYIGTNQLVSADETVSTLTLESLAYLPPALVNEARYYSRHSAGARWHTLGFDSGRFAFFAVDVSDHLDVNRIAANVGRNSSDSGKVSLAHVFENGAHDGYTLKPSTWDAFMDKFMDANDAYKYGGRMKPSPSKLPLVSLADLNLAIRRQFGRDSKEVISPFCRHIDSVFSLDNLVRDEENEGEMLRNMAFVTDSYLPSSLASGEDADYYDLNDPEYQPFSPALLRSKNPRSVNDVLTAKTPAITQRLLGKESHLCLLGLAALWDYLDEDNVPLSLAIPTTERVPMFCGLQPFFSGASLKATANVPKEGDGGFTVVSEPTPESRTVKRTETYSLDASSFAGAFGNAALNVLVTFPFRRDRELNDTFKVGGRVAIFLSETSLALRTSPSDVLHYVKNDGSSLCFGSSSQGTTTVGVFDHVIHVPLAEQTLTLKEAKESRDAVQKLPMTFPNDAARTVKDWLDNTPMYRITRQWSQTAKVDPLTGKKLWEPAEPDPADAENLVANETQCFIAPLTAGGIPDAAYANQARFNDMVRGGGGKKTVQLQVCVWLYVKNGDGKVVDLVPACMLDDKNLNNVDNASFPAKDLLGNEYPLMRFAAPSGTFDYDPMNLPLLAQPADASIPSDAVICADPRWNWAPEHWFNIGGGSLDASAWLANCQVGQDGRDRDIFMATSDAGYLQSIYELAFLPRLTNLEDYGADQVLGNMRSLSKLNQSALAASFGGTANRDFAWRTYRPFAVNGLERDDFEGVGFTSEGTGFRVNPYANSDAIVLAALANTPYNWAVASTNTTGENAVSESDRKAENFNERYCFNMKGDVSSKFEWTDLKSIAANIRSAVRSRADGDWKAAFDGLDWAGDAMGAGDKFAGATLSGSTCELSDADRRFLYGFWKDSFAAKQQLFLVFVRAEPTMMGGGAIGQTPPQLGARAVALVWRDPAKTQADVGGGQPRPHRTRVLFYRQVD